MNGFCHKCFGSNLKIEIVNGKFLCDDCSKYEDEVALESE